MPTQREDNLIAWSMCQAKMRNEIGSPSSARQVRKLAFSQASVAEHLHASAAESIGEASSSVGSGGISHHLYKLFDHCTFT